jgi:ParB family chromosome partitioning protein
MTTTKDIAIDQIKPNRYQPRTDFNPDSLFELAQSIRENGLIQPITVRKNEHGYEIIAGERRYRAMILAGFTSVPCLVIEADETQTAEMALVENIQREDLSAIEEAKAYLWLMKENDWTQERMAEKIGKSQSSVANKIRLLGLPMSIQDAIISKRISERHARALLTAPQEIQLEVFDQILQKNLNVKQTELIVEQKTADLPVKRKVKTKGTTRHIKIALNTVYQAVEMIRKTGITVKKEEIETEEDVRIVLRFPK